jgi:hypothetical protein
MTSERPIERVLESWLVDGPTESPGWLFDDVIDRVGRTRQRRFAQLRRRVTIVSGARILQLSAALFAAFILGVSLLGRVTENPSGPPPASPSITPSPSPEPSPSPALTPPVPNAQILPELDAVPTGRTAMRLVGGPWVVFDTPHSSDSLHGTGIRFDGAEFNAMSVALVYPDPCHEGRPPVEPLAQRPDAFVEAIRHQAGTIITEPTDVVISGYRGKRVEIMLPADYPIADCDGGQFPAWSGGLRSERMLLPGERHIALAVDVDGHLLVLDAAYPDSDPDGIRPTIDSLVSRLQIVP